jgi:hypothetical protein
MSDPRQWSEIVSGWKWDYRRFSDDGTEVFGDYEPGDKPEDELGDDP